MVGGVDAGIELDVVVDGLNMFNDGLVVELRGQDSSVLFETPILDPVSGKVLYRLADGSWCPAADSALAATPGAANPETCQ